MTEKLAAAFIFRNNGDEILTVERNGRKLAPTGPVADPAAPEADLVDIVREQTGLVCAAEKFEPMDSLAPTQCRIYILDDAPKLGGDTFWLPVNLAIDQYYAGNEDDHNLGKTLDMVQHYGLNT